MEITKDFVENVLKLDNVRETDVNFISSCPFQSSHSDGIDSRPSFNIHKSEGIWYCYACKRKGTLPQLVSLLYGTSLKDSWQIIERKSINKMINPIDRIEKELNNLLSPTNNKENGIINLPEEYDINLPKEARDFLIIQRGLTEEAIKFFQLGYCNSGFYSKRVIIPVIIEGRIITFIARSISNTVSLKYLIPKGTLKSSILFNMDSIFNDEVYIVEGPFDAMKLWSLGLKNAVSIFGCSLHPSQIRSLLRKGVKKVCIMLDGDAAGRKSSKYMEEQIKPYFEVTKIMLSGGMDPGDITSVDQLQELLSLRR